MDAGIPMTEYMVACTASLANGDVPLVDISHLEENSGGPNLTIAVLPLSGQVCVIGNSYGTFWLLMMYWCVHQILGYLKVIHKHFLHCPP
jgi:hypothetical protein